MEKLIAKHCTPVERSTAPLKGEALHKLYLQLGNDWIIIKEQKIEKEFKFKNFVDALAFVNRVGKVAESEGHHPDIFLTWGLVKLSIWSHAIGGLCENDFILCAKCDQEKNHG